MSNNYVQNRNALLANKVVQEFEKRHFEAYYTNTKEEALQKAISLIPKDKNVSWGGSLSINQIGLIDYLQNNNYKLLDRSKAQNNQEKEQIYKEALTCGTYLMSANAISADGQLVNIDCIGNRVAALIYGPDNVIVIAGMNKVVSNLDEALIRAREYSAPVNMQKISASSERKTPCVITGMCQNCKSKDSICCNIVITRLCNPEKRIKIILVGEELGF